MTVAQGKRLYITDIATRTGVDSTTWRAYVARGQAPHPNGRDIIRGRAHPWWTVEAVERWVAGRPGPGFRDRSPGVIYFVEAEDGRTIGDKDALPEGKYRTASLFFNPPDSDLPFAGQLLTVRYGSVAETPTIPALYAYSNFTDDTGTKRLRATCAVHNELFRKGQ